MDSTLIAILGFGVAMSVIALVGGLFMWLPKPVFERLLKPFVAFAAGALIDGAFFHMLPNALTQREKPIEVMLWVVAGFTIFLALDQLFEWHHCHRPPSRHTRPLGPLLLVADGFHNLLGGLAIGAVFMADLRAGIAAWIAAALHELPQEAGDFGAIVHSGIPPRRALIYNFISALAFPVGGVFAYLIGQSVDVAFLIALGAGSFFYIAAADLIPEIKRSDRLIESSSRFALFLCGLFLLFAAHVLY